MQSTLEAQTPLPAAPKRPLTIIRAEHLGMCFGVRDAITLARRHAADGPLTVLGELVHNERVLNGLKGDGIEIESDLGKVRTRQAMITAHGASQRRIDAIQARGLEVIEATCPLVHHAHRAVQKLAGEGYHVVLIGKRSHVEVRGLTEDLPACDIVLDEADIEALQPRPRIGIAAQTTQPIAKVRDLVAKIRARFPDSEVKFMDTVCQPTKQRQHAAEELGRECEVVVVIGGANSNNTRELVQTCSRHCSQVHHVQSPADLRPEWFEGAAKVGLTAGTSTPDCLIEEVERRILQLA